MLHSKIARRYSKALFDLSLERQSLDPVYQDLQSLLKIIQESVELQQFLFDPILPQSKQKEIIQNLFEGKIDPLVYQFLLFLVDKGRLNYLQEICRGFDALYFDNKGMTRATITTATAMDPEQLNRLAQKLEANTKRKIITKEIVDPNILGGFKVQIGDYVSDDSFATQLEAFHSNLINQG